MEEKKWTQLWLGYHKIYDGDSAWQIALDGFSKEQRVIANALEEFKKAINALTGESVPGGSETASGSKTLTLSKKDNIPAEGYKVTGTSEGITLEASDERGALY